MEFEDIVKPASGYWMDHSELQKGDAPSSSVAQQPSFTPDHIGAKLNQATLIAPPKKQGSTSGTQPSATGELRASPPVEYSAAQLKEIEHLYNFITYQATHVSNIPNVDSQIRIFLHENKDPELSVKNIHRWYSQYVGGKLQHNSGSKLRAKTSRS